MDGICNKYIINGYCIIYILYIISRNNSDGCSVIKLTVNW